MAESTHKYWIDWVKTIGMLLIVWGHYNPGPLTPYIYGVSVPLFFFMSGYLGKREESMSVWWKKNLRGIVIPYFLLICLVTLVSLPLGLWSLSLNKWIVYVAGILTGFQSMRGISCAGTMWFVFTLFWVKMLFQLCSGKKWAYLASILVLSAIAIGWGWQPNSDRYVWAEAVVPLAYPVYVIGYEAKRYNLERIFNWHWTTSIMVVISSALVYIAGCYFNGSPWMYKGEYGAHWSLFMLTALTGTLVCCYVGFALRKVGTHFAQTISVGSILVLAFHPKLMFLPEFLQLPDWYGMEYGVYSAMVVVLFWPIVLLVNRYCPFIMGGRKIK